MEDVKSLKLLEPFGESNKTPLFLLKNLKINSIRALSEGKHLKLTLKDDNYMIDAIGFNMGDLVTQYLLDDKVDVVGTLDINTFNVCKLQSKIVESRINRSKHWNNINKLKSRKIDKVIK